MNSPASATQSLAVRQRWLVVDDQADLSELMADVLADLDCASVENFTDPRAALAACLERAGGFDLVVTDRDMPGIDGLELARRIHAQARETKLLLVTATASDIKPEDLANTGISAVLSKPFSLSDLERAVRTVSAAPTSAAAKNTPLTQAA